jgi:hypothetical protein
MDKMRQWTLLTVVGIVAVMGAGWFLAVSPQRHHAAELRTQAQTQLSANTQLQGRVAQLEQQKKGLPGQQHKLNLIAAKIPDNPALPALIRQLSAAANGAGVDLVSLSPSQPVSSTPAGAAATVPTTGTATAGSAGASSVLQIPVTIASGSTGSATGAPALPPGTLKGQINAVVFESPQVASAPAPVAPVATSK